jgi:PAS domain S-box-containing protein
MRLFWQVYVASLACVLFSAALLTAVLSYRDAEYSLAQLRNEQRLLAVTAASQVESGYHESIWPFGMLWAITKEPQFVFWQISDSDGKTVLSDGPLDAPFATLEDRIKEPRWAIAGKDSGEVEEWVVPLAVGSATHPWLFRLGFNTNQVREHVRRSIITNSLLALGISFLLVGLSFVFTRRLLRPLRSLTVAAVELERGNLDVSLPPADKDELGQLVHAFRTMTLSIKERDRSIQEHVDSLRRAKDDLEVRVEERTRQLRSAKVRVEATAASLRENEERMRAIIEHAADGIITATEAGIIEVFNPSAAKIFGYEAEELIGRSIEPLFAEGYGIRSDGQLVHRTDDGSLAMDRSAEVVARRKNGSIFPLQIALSEVHLLEERKLLTAIVRDISEQKVAEAERKEMHERLVQASRLAGMAEVATSVLHNVGNVLNSVNVSATMVSETLRDSKVRGLGKATALMHAHAADLGEFLTRDASGKRIPEYLEELGRALESEREVALQELASLLANIGHIKAIVTRQQAYARIGGEASEEISIPELCDDALKIGGADLARGGVRVVREYGRTPLACVDRHKVLQILVNLVSNAEQALMSIEKADRRLVVRTGVEDDASVVVRVIDNGMGIAKENLFKIFNHGFTTKREGHGFGLHSSALAAMELGGALGAESDGVGKGATFSLRIPLRPKGAKEVGREVANVEDHAP